MPPRVLIVEDEIVVAANLEAVLDDMGVSVTGIAPDAATAIALAEKGADIALVDLNLRDGLTGPEIGKKLSDAYGITVIFMTANPRIVADGVEGVLGVVPKPMQDDLVEPIVNFALYARSRQIADEEQKRRLSAIEPSAPPRGLQLFASA